jgi:hypothetical protein
MPGGVGVADFAGFVWVVMRVYPFSTAFRLPSVSSHQGIAVNLTDATSIRYHISHMVIPVIYAL